MRKVKLETINREFRNLEKKKTLTEKDLAKLKTIIDTNLKNMPYGEREELQLKTQQDITKKMANLVNLFKMKISNKKEEIKEEETGEIIQQDEPEKKQEIEGDGVLLYGNGISNHTINKIMNNFKWFGYIGCFSFDELEKVYKYIIKHKLKHFSFIINSANNNKDKTNPLHWIAVYCDGASIEYYDCSGKNLRIKDFENITAKYLPYIFNHYLKFKFNNIKNQSLKSNTCGFFAMKFLISRYVGISFKDATNYKNVNMNEKNINQFRKNINKFGLL